MRRTRLLLCTALLVTAAACRKKPAEPAPVKAGDFFEYKFTGSGTGSNYTAKVNIKAGPSSDALLVEGVPDGNVPPTEVDLALDAGKLIKNHYLGQLWLPPAHRVPGTKSRCGQVKGLVTHNGRNTWEVEQYPGGPGGHWFFDETSGFLVAYVQPLSGGLQEAALVSSSIAGL